MQRRDFLKYAGGLTLAGLAGGCLGRSADVAVSTPDATPAWRPLDLPEPQNVSGAQRFLTPRPAAPAGAASGVSAISRAAWHADNPIPNRLHAMGLVQYVTVHHEGNPHPNRATSVNDVSECLRDIQREHRRRMGAGDIGYHYIIDGAGRIWQGREVQYQGAHVKYHNPHNIGIMVLGNFDIQKPTHEQLRSVDALCQALLAGYRLPADRLRRHADFANTRCPGKYLIPHIARLRSTLA